MSDDCGAFKYNGGGRPRLNRARLIELAVVVLVQAFLLGGAWSTIQLKLEHVQTSVKDISEDVGKVVERVRVLEHSDAVRRGAERERQRLDHP